ncbi:MAG: long-chain fatty acid--CoA ligase [Armatimonas sp.]
MQSNDDNLDPATIPLVEHARSTSAGSYLYSYPNIGAALQARVQRQPGAEFITFRDTDGSRRSLNFADLDQAALRVAQKLLVDLELQPGCRIATLTGNSLDTVILYFGAWLSGITVVPINVTEDDDRIAFVLENAGISVAFAPEDQAGRCNDTRVLLPSEMLAESPLENLPSVGLNSEALIVYTSGTTGAPKGVVLEHQNLIADAQGITRWHAFEPLGVAPSERAMCVLPIHHVNGIVVTLITPLLSGGSVVLNRKFSASKFWQILTEEKCTWCSVVPTILAFLCECKPENWHAPPDFRHFICGAGPLTTDLAHRFHTHFGLKVVHGYGLSETTCYSCFLPIELSEDDYARWMWGEGFPSIGVPLPGKRNGDSLGLWRGARAGRAGRDSRTWRERDARLLSPPGCQRRYV